MRQVKENKVSMLNESQMEINQQIVSTTRDKKHKNKKFEFRRGTTLLYQGKDSDPFEDSRITMLFFEKYKTIELVRLMMILACTTLTILEYEYSFATQITGELDYEIEIILYLILIMTILIIIITIASFQSLLIYQKKALLVTPNANIFETKLFYSLIIEILILLPTSTPFTKGIKWHFSQPQAGDVQRFYYVNEILTYFMLMRIIIVGDILLKLYPYYNSQVGRLCRIYSAELNTHLTLKLAIRDWPFTTITVLFILGMFACSYTLEISERALIRTDEGFETYSIANSFWVNMITILTVGYGDFYPYTNLGRFSMFISVFYGVTCTSLFTAMLTSLLNPNSGEMMAWALLEKADSSKGIKSVSRHVLFNVFNLVRNKKKSEDDETAQSIRRIETLVQEVGSRKRSYRDIDGEEFLAMVQRKFRDTKQMFEEYIDYLKNQIEQQDSIAKGLKGQMEFSFKSKQQLSTAQKESNRSQVQLGSANTHDKQSKDEHFFQNLEEQNQDPYLMNFDD